MNSARMARRMSAIATRLGCLVLIGTSCSSINNASLQTTDVHISGGTPKHWSLADAHYLLNQSQDRARQLKLTSPPDLDPNQFNSVKLQQIDQAFELAVKYDQSIGKNNELSEKAYSRNVAQEGQLQEQLDEQYALAQSESSTSIAAQADLSIKIAELEAEKQTKHWLQNRKTELEADIAGLEADANEDNQSEIDAKIAVYKQDLENTKGELEQADRNIIEKEKEKGILEARLLETQLKKGEYESAIDRLQAELNRVRSNKESVALPTLSTPSTSPSAALIEPSNSVFKKAIDGLISDKSFTQDLIPSFSVSDRVNNYIRSEQELLARQLTMLENEVGPDQTVVFLELPYSIHASQKFGLDRRAQIAWQISDYCTYDPYKLRAADRSINWEHLAKEIPTHVEKKIVDLLAPGLFPTAESESETSEQEEDNDKSVFFNKLFLHLKEKNIDVTASTSYYISEKGQDKLVNELRKIVDSIFNDKQLYAELACAGRARRPTERMVFRPHATSLIPSTSAYNVAEYDSRSLNAAINGVFSWLSGVGVGVEAKRRSQIFEQQARQNVFAFAYGSGKHQFGWVFEPRPNKRLLDSGAKSTYAVIAVPKEATALSLSSHGCILNQNAVIDSRSITANNILPRLDPKGISYALDEKKTLQMTSSASRPSKTNRPRYVSSSGEILCDKPTSHPIVLNKDYFWVERIDYGAVLSGDIATVIVKGSGFSPHQLSVLVNGVPLRKHTGFEADDSNPRASFADDDDKSGIDGTYEVMDSNIVLNIRMPEGYVGTPEITLVSPSKSVSLNYLKLELGIFGDAKHSMQSLTDKPMFNSALKLTDKKLLKEKTCIVDREMKNVHQLTLRGEGLLSTQRYIESINGSYSTQEIKKKFKYKIINDKLAYFCTSEDVGKFNFYLRKRASGKSQLQLVTMEKKVKKPSTTKIASLKLLRVVPGPDGLHKMDFAINGNQLSNDLMVCQRGKNDSECIFRDALLITQDKKNAYFSDSSNADSIIYSFFSVSKNKSDAQSTKPAGSGGAVIATGAGKNAPIQNCDSRTTNLESKDSCDSNSANKLNKKFISQVYFEIPKTPIIDTIESGYKNASCLPIAGGTRVKISGTNLAKTISVHVGDKHAKVVSQNEDTIWFISPPGHSKTKDVLVSVESAYGKTTADPNYQKQKSNAQRMTYSETHCGKRLISWDKT